MSARDRILARLRAANARPVDAPDLAAFYAGAEQPAPVSARIDALCDRLTAARAEVLRSTSDSWTDDLCERLLRKRIRRLALSPGQQAARSLAERLQQSMRVVRFEGPFESWKREVFESVDAGFVDAQAGVADLGALVLEHGPDCPRALSLIPPVSVVRILASRLHGSLHEVATLFAWHECASSNRVVVSSPTRTADIQQVLAYGAHGPRELIVCVVDDLNVEMPG